MKPITSRPIPEGYILNWDPTTWNVGHVFRWSDVYDQYMKECTITIKPGQTLPEAFEAVINEPMFPGYEVFFVEESA